MRLSLREDSLKCRKARWMLLRLRSLLYNLGRHSDRAGCHLAHASSQHVYACSTVCTVLLSRELFLDALVRHEEERCSRSRTHDCRADAIVDAAETAGGPEAFGGLETCLESVEREERGIDCGASYAACLQM